MNVGKIEKSNKKIGNDFELEFASKLSQAGFWVLNIPQVIAGQPSDIIAVKNGKAFLFDCKVCQNDYFDKNRIEENQLSSMTLWQKCGNGSGVFALKTSAGVFLFTLSYLVHHKENRVTFLEITRKGCPFEEWLNL